MRAAVTARPALVRWITSVNEDWARVLLSNSSELTEDQKDRVLEVVGARLLDITRVIKDGGSKLEGVSSLRQCFCHGGVVDYLFMSAQNTWRLLSRRIWG
jgi:hypothetical protein